MSSDLSFNPYHKWLGIPLEEQPPHHYRLLGVKPFESDPDVIANAADGRMSQLKTFQSGKHSALSQRLLNEIAAAKVCLLNPGKKARYDQQLRGLLDRGGVAGAAAGGSTGAVVMPQIKVATAASPATRTRSVQPRWLAPVAVAGVGVAVVIVLILALGRDNGSASAKHPAVSPPDAPKPISEKTEVEPKKPPKEEPEPFVPPPIKEPPEKPAVKPDNPDAGNPAEPDQPEPDPAKPAQGPDELAEGPKEGNWPVIPGADLGAEDEPDPAAKPGKPPVPDEAALAAAETRVRELFQNDLAEAKTPQQRLALATKLSRHADEIKDDQAARFVLMRMAAQLSAESGGLSGALAIADQMGQLYDLKALGLKVDLVERAADQARLHARTLAGVQPVLDAADVLVDEAMEADDYDTAGRVLKLSQTLGRKLKDTQRLRELAARVREIDRLKGAYRSIQQSLDTLADEPADGEANLTVGRWRCFSKGDWQRGLANLAKGSDPEVAAVARRELARPKQAKEQQSLADAWWSLAETEPAQVKAAIQAHAAQWYEKALPGLSGLEKVAVQKRLESLAAAGEPGGSKVRGMVKSGNVALAGSGTRISGKGLTTSASTASSGLELIDGNTRYDKARGYVNCAVPGEVVLTFPQVYSLREIRVLFWDGAPRSYNYRIEISEDGTKFSPLIDRSQGMWTGLQRHTFAPHAAKAIKLVPLGKLILEGKPTPRPEVVIVEIEAYCVQPGR